MMMIWALGCSNKEVIWCPYYYILMPFQFGKIGSSDLEHGHSKFLIRSITRSVARNLDTIKSLITTLGMLIVTFSQDGSQQLTHKKCIGSYRILQGLCHWQIHGRGYLGPSLPKDPMSPAWSLPPPSPIFDQHVFFTSLADFFLYLWR